MLKLVRLRSRTHTSWIISCLRQRFCVEIGVPARLCTNQTAYNYHVTPCVWRLAPSYYIVKFYEWIFNSVKAFPNEECVKQYHMVVCDFTCPIPCMRKRKFSSCICTWKLRDTVTASQFQLAFKVKTTTVATSVATTAGADANTANRIESAWSKL